MSVKGKLISIFVVMMFTLTCITYSSKGIESVPEHMTITMTETPMESVTLSWVTNSLDVSNAVVQVIKASDQEGFDSPDVMIFTSATLTSRNHKTFSTVNATSLEPGIDYLYRCGNGSKQGWSQVGGFKTASNNEDPFTFLYVSDLQVYSPSEDAKKTKKSLQNAFEQFGKAIAFVYNAGDFTDAANDEGEWDTLFNISNGVFGQFVTAPVMGNHDKKEGRYLDYYFPTPRTGLLHTPSKIPYVYAFDYGAAHFMTINLEYITDGLLQEQMDWVREEVIASHKPWQIILLHRAVYSGGSHIADPSTIETRKLLSPLFDEIGIDVVLQGHDHVYCRGFVNGDGSKPEVLTLNNNPQRLLAPDAPLYMVTITGGLRFYEQVNYKVSDGDPLLPQYEFLDVFNDNAQDAKSIEGNQMTYTGITVSKDMITFETNTTTTKTFENVPLDSFTIYKSFFLLKSIGDQIKNQCEHLLNSILY